jgi:hypothetical protein
MYNACNNAQSLAREIGVHRTTVVDWIKKGHLKAAPHKKGRRWYIGEDWFRTSRVERLKKPYPKYSKPYSQAEIDTLLAFPDKSDAVLAKMLGRSENAIHIKRWRLRRQTETRPLI